MTEFEKLGLHQFLVETCQNLGIASPTPIQAAAIPHILRGRNLFGQAQTGAGKTAAFSLPVIHALSADPFGVFALVLSPTRELAEQTALQFRALGASCALTVLVVCGGKSALTERLALLRRPHVVVATPGRLAEHLLDVAVRSTFSHLRVLVLDEADRLLAKSSHLRPTLKAVLSALPPADKRQTLLFSATRGPALKYAISKQIKYKSAEAANKINSSLNVLKVVAVSTDEMAVPAGLRGSYVFVPRALKEAHALSLLTRAFGGKTALVFVARRAACRLLAETLRRAGVSADALHAGLEQGRRSAALGKFREGKSRVLVCTDLAARGLDVRDVGFVLNFNVPLAAVVFLFLNLFF